MTTNYHPRPGSLADRVLKYLQITPRAQLTRTEVADLFNVSATSVFSNLETAIKAGAIEQARNEDLEYIYRLPDKHWPSSSTAVPAVTSSAAQPPIAQQPVAAKPSRAASTIRRREVTPSDFEQLVVDDGVPLPKHGAGNGANKWEPLLAKLTKAGQSIAVPLDWKIPLASEATKRNKKAKDDKAAPTYKVGMDKDGTRARIWRNT